MPRMRRRSARSTASRRPARGWTRRAQDGPGGRPVVLLPGEDHPRYERATRGVWGVEPPRRGRPGRAPPPKRVRVVPAETCYATVRKRREKGRVVEVVRT